MNDFFLLNRQHVLCCYITGVLDSALNDAKNTFIEKKLYVEEGKIVAKKIN